MKLITDFNLSAKKQTGGVTGSARVKDYVENKNYQLKPSILDNPKLIRRVKAEYSDRENFGEVIASCIGRELLGDKVPEVSLVYDHERKRVSVASKYLEGDSGGVRTLDEYAKEKGATVSEKQRHARFIAGTTDKKEQGEIALDGPEMSSLKQDLARAIAVSIATGDHDVNPGNMMVITKDGKSHIARIDFGHAFNDLLNALKANGGQLLDAKNPVLDFFNRPKIAGLGGDSSKLWRDYPGLIPSQEMVIALQEMSQDFNTKALNGVRNAENEFRALATAMTINQDMKGLAHLEKSLGAICSNVSGKKLNPSSDINEAITNAFTQISAFTVKQGNNFEKVANIMQVQMDIDAALKSGTPLPQRSIDLLNDPDFPTKNGKIQWVKSGPNPAFSGSVEEYMLHQVNQLTKGASPEKKEEIIQNYRTVREQNIYTAPKKVESAHLTNSFKQNFQQEKANSQLKDIDPQKLISKLQDYIDNKLSEEKKSINFGLYTADDKIIAAGALIKALNGQNNVDLAKHADALKNGVLGDTIHQFIQQNTDARSISKKNAVDMVLNAVEKGSIKQKEEVVSSVQKFSM
jgi:hypothetical protein